ncbi:RmlC-like cupin [Corynespora cassiicola Philippines]|uniref:RmlC-like cupin n=1 Tax=Corynespora cassiicola Philippines TaxID=1448308 RepID=A0A2T2NGM6_CORCC|nr:RmlC-like cupin [Corynespora cassiicola Philippines]
MSRAPFQPYCLFCLLLLSTLPTALAVDKTANTELNQRLKLAATALDRHGILSHNADWIFDFNVQRTWSFNPGSVVSANAATFPVMTGLGMTVAMLNLGPCAMLPPHLHQRATNCVVAVSGNTTTWMVEENGVDTVSAVLTSGVMTVFPRGSLHVMQNTGCHNAQLISALDSEDPGTLNILNGLWQFPPDMIHAAFGDTNLNLEDMKSRLPPIASGADIGSRDCLKRCGLEHGKKV